MCSLTCASVLANVDEVTRGGPRSSYWWPVLKAGLGFGASACRRISSFYQARRRRDRLRSAQRGERVNRQRVDQLVDKVKKPLGHEGKQIGILGIAFKPNTDDIRLAPAIEVIRRLLAEGASCVRPIQKP